MPAQPYSHISLFTGAMGLDLGLELAGFRTLAAVESDKNACKTIKANRPDFPLIEDDIHGVTTSRILRVAGLKKNEPHLVSGGPSCQPFSTAGRRQSFQDPRGLLIDEFIRVVDEARPKLFILENVRGIMSAAVRHRPLNQRGDAFPPLHPDEQQGSALKAILKKFDEIGYTVNCHLLNSADYGTPQVRRRVFFFGSRDGQIITPPAPTHFEHPHRGQRKWNSLAYAFRGLKEKNPLGAKYSATKERYLKLVPEGGDWRDLPKRKQRWAIGRAYLTWGGRTGFCRRLSMRRPSPTVVTTPLTKASCMCHPKETRPLTVREYARIQQFPDDWAFEGTIAHRYAQIGNAVPVGLAYAVGTALANTLADSVSSKTATEKGLQPILPLVRA